jgi:type VI protein secretion system component Hcp
MRRTISQLLLTGMFSMVAIASSSAQSTTTVMLVPGVPGSSVVSGHQNWIDVFSMSQGLTPAKKSTCDLNVAKKLDIAGPLLWVATQTGQVFQDVEIDVLKTSGAALVKIYQIDLLQAQVSSISDSGASGGNPFFTESVAWTAPSITISVFPQLPDGSAGTPVTATIACQ